MCIMVCLRTNYTTVGKLDLSAVASIECIMSLLVLSVSYNAKYLLRTEGLVTEKSDKTRKKRGKDSGVNLSLSI